MIDLPAIVLVGGRGVRARPLSLSSGDYLRSKAAMNVAGKTIVEWMVETLRAQGIHQFFIVANGKENRLQTKAILGHGERYGVQVRYSRTRLDHFNTGSGAATLHGLEHWNLSGPALVLPSDSVFDVDVASMLGAHLASAAVVTVGTVTRSAAEAAGKYGVFKTDADCLVTRFLEKPDPDALTAITSGDHVPTNAGMYLIDCDRLRLATRDPGLAQIARRQLDWGADLLPWLVSSGCTVLAHRIPKFGDLGSVRDYLSTVRDVLMGEYPLLSALIDPPVRANGGARIHASTLNAKSKSDGRTLAERIAEGKVEIGSDVRIGRDVEIGSNVWLADCDIGDGVDIGDSSVLRGVVCGDYSIIGPGARLSDTFIGSMVEIRSTAIDPVVLEEFCALGDSVWIRAGVQMRGVSVYPGLDIRGDFPVAYGTTLTDVRDIMQGARGFVNAQLHVEVELMRIAMKVNGTLASDEVEPNDLLVDYLRSALGLTGAKVGCDTGHCGACVVRLDGKGVKSCLVLAVQADGSTVETIEGLAPIGQLTPLQEAFYEEHAAQCGFCTPGMVMSLTELLERDPHPNEDGIRSWLSGNICRCTGYQSIVRGVLRVAERDEND